MSHEATWDIVCFHDQFVVNPLFHSELNKIRYNSNRVEIWATKRVNACSVQFGHLLSNLKQLSRWLARQICPQIGWLCCNAFCSESICTHPLCSSFLHVGLFQERLQLLYLGLFSLEQVHDTAFIPVFFASGPFVACCCFFFSTGVGAWLKNALGGLSREIAWRLIHVHSWKEGCSMVTIRAAFYCFSQWPLFRGYKTVGAGFLRPRTNSQTSATSCHQKNMLIMLDVEYWDVKSLQTVLRF